MKQFITLFSVLVLFGCSKDGLQYPSPFTNSNEGQVSITMGTPKDARGYFHYKFDRTKSFNYTSVYAEATPITNERYLYNGVSVVESEFDTDTYWVFDTLTVTIPLYNPFRSLYSSPYFNTPLSVGTKTVTLSQYRNTIVPLIATSSTYFKNYDARMDEYKPSGNNMWTKQLIGPIPAQYRGDTIKIYVKTYWECGNYSLTYPERTEKIDSLSLIID